MLGIVCFALLVHWAGRKLYLYYSLLDWSFAADIVHRRRPELEVNLDRLARAFAERVRASMFNVATNGPLSIAAARPAKSARSSPGFTES